MTRPRPPKAVADQARRIDVRSKALALPLADALRRLSYEELRHALHDPRAYAEGTDAHRPRVRKAARSGEEELRRLLALFGLRQAADAAGRVGGVEIPESLIRDAIDSKDVRIKWFWRLRAGAVERADQLVDATREVMREKVRDLLATAEREYPKPGPAEIARRMSNAFLGPGEAARERRVMATEGSSPGLPTIALSKPSIRKEHVLVTVDVEALNRAWATKPELYVGPGGKGGIGSRYADARAFIAGKPKSMSASEVSLDARGVPVFEDGRHRFAAIRDLGIRTVQVAVAPEDAERMVKLYPARSPLPLPDVREYAFSPERAALIARTETSIAENAGIFAGYEASGVEEIEWLAFRDGRSGDRHHERMHGKRVKLGDYFILPSGAQMMFPGDSDGPIGDLANCRCTSRAVHRGTKQRRG